jgi:hypothetical protein
MNSPQQLHEVRLRGLLSWVTQVHPGRLSAERMNSPLENREVRLRGLPRREPSRCTKAK